MSQNTNVDFEHSSTLHQLVDLSVDQLAPRYLVSPCRARGISRTLRTVELRGSDRKSANKSADSASNSFLFSLSCTHARILHLTPPMTKCIRLGANLER